VPERIQLSRKRGWRKPEGAISVARPHVLGNPYRVYEHCKGPGGDWGVEDTGRLFIDLGHGWTKLGAHQAAVSSYRTLLDDIYPPEGAARALLAMNYAGHDLACWCPLDMPCHADVLLEVVNDPQYAGLIEAYRAEQLSASAEQPELP
jgi:hypothetical protein